MNDTNFIPLKGKRIAVVLESKFIPEEISAYRYGFGTYGAEVDFYTRLNYTNYSPDHVELRSDVDPNDQPEWATPEILRVEKDKGIDSLNLDRYAALLMSANYTSVRLRFNELPPPEKIGSTFNVLAHLQGAPFVQKFAEAMGRKDLVKGFLCHGLWILTPNRQLLAGRRVVCNEVVAADIYNCGANLDFTQRVITDGDVVTGYSKHEVIPYVQAIAAAIVK